MAAVVNMLNMRYCLGVPRYTETIFPVKKVVGLTAALAEQISEYRHKHRISSENEAIRRLIELGLQATTDSTDPRTPR
jgi:hypothetical protein